jgi:hypothetical protein
MTFEGAVVVRSRRSGTVALVSLAVAIAMLVAAAAIGSSELAIVATYAIWPLAIALALHLGWTRAKRQPARIDVSGKTVSANGVALRRNVTSARIILQPPGFGVVVEIGRRFDPYPARIVVPTEDDARGLVRALGLDPREGPRRFRAPLGMAWVVTAVVAATIACPFAIALLGTVLGTMALVAAAVGFVRLSTQTFTIGDDGLLVQRFLRKRFVPWASVASLQREVRYNRNGPMVSRGFTVERDSGNGFFVDTTLERMRPGMFEGDHLYDAAHAAHARARRIQPRAADVLARGARPTHEWLRQLATAREVRYRVAAIPDEELVAVLANPSAEKTARVGAAICLARAGEDARAKVRVAVEDIAAPEVRAAALAALSDDEEALAAALDALEA